MTTTNNNFPDLGLGVGLRTAHYNYILNHTPPVDWFEIISENYLDSGGRPNYFLQAVAERYPIVMHGVSLSIGSTDPLNVGYLRRLKALAKRINARWISDHLCWTGVAGLNTHDLLPLPYTDEALKHTIARVRRAAEILERPLVLENPSSYVEFATSTLTEWQFLALLAQEADCYILLDVNNVYVSAYNHGWDAYQYIDGIPGERVVQYHIAGHTNMGSHIIDTHRGEVAAAVWRLYRHALARSGNRATLIEWDDEIPDFDTVHQEALKASLYREVEAVSYAA